MDMDTDITYMADTQVALVASQEDRVGSKEGQAGSQAAPAVSRVDTQVSKDIILNKAANIIPNQVSALQDPTLMPWLKPRMLTKDWEAYLEVLHRPLQIRKPKVLIRVPADWVGGPLRLMLVLNRRTSIQMVWVEANKDQVFYCICIPSNIVISLI